MKSFIAFSVVLTSIGSSAQAATLEAFQHRVPEARSEIGAFAGARVRFALGGAKTRNARLRAGLTVVPVRQNAKSGGNATVLRFGNGFEFGFTGVSRKPEVSLAGQPLQETFRAAEGKEDGKKSGGPSTAVLVLGGVLLAAGVGALVLNDALHDASD